MRTFFSFFALGLVLTIWLISRLPDLLVGAWIDAGRKANGKELA